MEEPDRLRSMGGHKELDTTEQLTHTHTCTHTHMHTPVLMPLGCMHAKSLQSCPTLCIPMDCNLLGSSVHGILQARILE